eukprot:TRINITY_DN3571_c0_g1_i2.p1 TRINITY_DN3571_c0_g1~~TRINITY_DN3571_c0_g1_i2.p1  ORF type:complete len:102 (+),score=4.34 TRINITY_DN3571_c0_g1_i2:66-371(+)
MTLFLKREPALITFSQRTTTIFCPDRSCLARVLERRPKIWSFPSIIITFSCISHRFLFIGLFLFFYLIVSPCTCLLYTSDAADEEDSVDLGGRRLIPERKE